MKKLYSIGEVSKIKDITIKALRYYHKMGILEPKVIDEESGYRYYTIDQFMSIDIIKWCRSLGTSIAELQEMFKESDTDKLLEVLRGKREEARENIKRLNEVIDNITEVDRFVESSRKLLENQDIILKFFEERRVLVSHYKEEDSFDELIYYSDLEKIIESKKVMVTFDRGLIYDLSENGTLTSKYVFSGILDGDLEGIETIVLKKGNYLTISYKKENEEKSFKRIIKYIEENNLKVREIIVMELLDDIFTIDDYSCQIQALIENL